MPILTKPQEIDSIEDIKELIKSSKEDFKTIQRHWKRIEEMYEDFEDVIVKLENRLQDLELGIEPDDTKELKIKLEKLEVENEAFRKEARKANKMKNADNIADLIPDLED